MLIGLVGPTASGKETIADFLVSTHGFTRIRISIQTLSSSSSSSPDIGNGIGNGNGNGNGIHDDRNHTPLVNGSLHSQHQQSNSSDIPSPPSTPLEIESMLYNMSISNKETNNILINGKNATGNSSLLLQHVLSKTSTSNGTSLSPSSASPSPTPLDTPLQIPPSSTCPADQTQQQQQQQPENVLGQHPHLNEKTFLDFSTSDSALDYVTSHWQDHFVIILSSPTTVDLVSFKKRPFFLMVAVEAPALLRYERWKHKRSNNNNNTTNNMTNLSLESFLSLDDGTTFSPLALVKDHQQKSWGTGLKCLHEMIASADVRIINSSRGVEGFWKVLQDEVDLVNPERLRPGWDLYFMRLCDLAAQRSNCMKRRVGCIIAKDRRVIATGYNGTPRGLKNCNEGGCARCNENAVRGSQLDMCLCLHAEENALLEAGRERVANGGASILYCNTCPCVGCAKKIIQAGVKEVVYSQSYGMDEMTKSLFDQAGLIIRQLKEIHCVYGSV
ncbi:Deoxycytidine monophosphate (dCMP) deaminase [Blyttiomyces sp. JEL0837]|nr:Deoxycytidine monophosphate (dCMP) deaminase [Blyttiomyces sp. JEL0837]